MRTSEGMPLAVAIRAGPLARPRFSLLIFDFFVIGIDHVFFRTALTLPALGAPLTAGAILWARAGLRSCLGLGLAVHRLGQFMRRVLQRLGRAIDLVRVLGLEL